VLQFVNTVCALKQEATPRQPVLLFDALKFLVLFAVRYVNEDLMFGSHSGFKSDDAAAVKSLLTASFTALVEGAL